MRTERDVESQYDYFGARYYDSRIGRWLSTDPLAEKYPGCSPYDYVANNPLAFVDLRGDSLTVSGEDKAVSAFQAISNNRLEGYYNVTVGAGGLVSVERTTQQGELSAEGQAFYDALMGAASLDVGMVSAGLVYGSEDVLFGTFETSTIDVGDMVLYGNGPLESAAGMLGHEISEQTYKQLSAMEYPEAHAYATNTGNKINGSVLLEADRRSLNIEAFGPNLTPRYSGPLYKTYRYPGYMNYFFGVTNTIRTDVVRNNIMNVQR